MTIKISKHPSLFKTVLRIFGWLTVFVIAVLVIAFIYISSKKNEIGKELLLRANSEFAGKITLENIKISSLLHFPNLEIELQNVQLHAPSKNDINTAPVFVASSILLVTNLHNILSNRIEIDYVAITGGSLFLDRDSLGGMNIFAAFAFPTKDTATNDSSNFYMQIDSVYVADFKFVLQDQKLKNTLPLTVSSMIGDFKYENSHIFGTIKMSSEFGELLLSDADSISLAGTTFTTTATYSVRLKEREVAVTSDDILLDKIPLAVDFYYSFGKIGAMEIKLKTRKSGIDLAPIHHKKSGSNQTDKVHIRLYGYLNLQIKLKWKQNGRKSFVENLKVELKADGKNLAVRGIDIDDLINKYERSQNFNLIDIGAVLLAGPVGLAVTKGTDYSMLILGKRGDSTQIPHFISYWKLEKGMLTATDVAMGTENNLVSLGGWFNPAKETLDFSINLVDKSGCSIMNQHYFGSATNPKTSKVKIVKTLFGSVINMSRDIGLVNCDIAYSGAVEHPQAIRERIKKEEKTRKKAEQKKNKPLWIENP